MGEFQTITASDGFALNAYVARPASQPKGGVVVVQEVWGVNHWVRSVADQYAAEGYLAVAPAMFDRIEHGYQSEDYSDRQFLIIRPMLAQFNADTALLDVAAAVALAADGGKVGITGFCFGGMMTWRAAHAGLGLACGSGYYGGGIPNYIGLAPTIPLEMHFGDRDSGIPNEQVADLKAQHPLVDIHMYPAEHGFCNADRPERFDPAAAALAHQRSLAFFGQYLA
jgi:carboxymethylenebutenolidase